jgi:hypothetical protein
MASGLLAAQLAQRLECFSLERLIPVEVKRIVRIAQASIAPTESVVLPSIHYPLPVSDLPSRRSPCGL